MCLDDDHDSWQQSHIAYKVDTRGVQINRNSHGPCLQCAVDALHCVVDEDQRGHGADSEKAKTRKMRKNADNTEKTRTVQEKRASTEELSLVDPTDVICSSWTRNGEIRSMGLLLATFNKVHKLTY